MVEKINKIFKMNMTKKMMSAILLFIILFQVILPTFVVAKNEEEKEYSIEDAIKEMYTITGLNMENNVKTKLTNVLRTNLGNSYIETDGEKAFIYCYNKPSWISISSIRYDYDASDQKYLAYEMTIGSEFNIQTIRQGATLDKSENTDKWGCPNDCSASSPMRALVWTDLYVDRYGQLRTEELTESYMKENGITGTVRENYITSVINELSYIASLLKKQNIKSFDVDTAEGYSELSLFIRCCNNYVNNPGFEIQEIQAGGEEEGYNVQVAMLIDQIKKEYGDILKEEDKAVLEGVDETITENIQESGQAQYDELIEESTPEENNGADIGGILLSPVFALINFVVDAITGSLDAIMNGEPILSSLGILTTANPGVGEMSTSDAYAVDVSSFVVLDIGGYKYPNIKYTPEEIFTGEIDLLSIDFISGKNFKGETITGNWEKIRSVIASWYKALRMFAIIGLLSVLIYTGIKIMLSANAKDKAKYKEWIINWFIAVAILFSMHYMMSFINSIINEVNAMLGEACGDIVVKVENGKDGEVTEGATEYFTTNLMGLVRFMIQSENFMIKIGYEVMYIALLVYTIKFTFVYLKRVLNMAFLTLIAPIVALTYPIDKLNDGSAQGFNMWLKEYIFNALLQPVHYIMYYILLGSAISVAAANPVYGIVVLMFMAEAEKLLKKIFGFDKANGGTVGGMAGAFAAGALASNIKNIAKLASGGNGSKNANSGVQKNEMIDAPKPNDKPGFAEAFGDDEGETPEPSLPESTGGASAADGNQDDSNPVASQGSAQLNGHQEETQTSGAELPAEGSEANEPNSNAQANSSDTPATAQGQTSTPASTTSSAQTQDKGIPIRDMATSVGRGLGAVGKRLMKPVWDFDHTGATGRKYNRRRLAKNIVKGVAKGVGGFALGTAAAAVQAGISITDGKYNPMEGMATMTAGFVGASGVVNKVSSGMGSIADTYREGAYAGDKNKQMERAQKRFPDRDDVIAFNRREYAGKEEEYMMRERDNYLPSGVTDLKDMKRCMKYADSMVGKTDNMTSDQIKAAREKADRKAAATLDFRKRLQDQGQLAAVYDKDKQEKYIKQMVEEAKRNGQDATKTEKQYRNAFKSIVAYDAANA